MIPQNNPDLFVDENSKVTKSKKNPEIVSVKEQCYVGIAVLP